MFHNKKIAPYIFAFLAFCVVSSKHIIIYNEEILVALSFLFFVVFVSYYFGGNIKESLDERSNAIQFELQNFLTLKKDCLSQLFKQHNLTISANSVLESLTNFTKLQLKNKSLGSEKALKTIFSHQLNHKLKNLSISKLDLKQKLQQIISDELLSSILIKHKKLKNQNNKKNTQKLDLNSFKKAIKILNT